MCQQMCDVFGKEQKAQYQKRFNSVQRIKKLTNCKIRGVAIYNLMGAKINS